MNRGQSPVGVFNVSMKDLRKQMAGWPKLCDQSSEHGDRVGLRPLDGCHIDTPDGLLFAKSPRGTGEA